MTIKYVKGDLIKMALEGRFNMIVHGCNCYRTMGAGIAAQVRAAFPKAYERDRQTTDGEHKLGTLSYAWIDVGTEDDSDMVCVVNAYTQVQPGPHFDLEALRDSLSNARDLISNGGTIGLPKIGAGIGGGDWNEIEKVIEDVLGDMDVTVVEYQP